VRTDLPDVDVMQLRRRKALAHAVADLHDVHIDRRALEDGRQRLPTEAQGPEQARILTVSDKAAAYANEVQATLAAAGLRVDADVSPDKLGAKIRRAQMSKIPYMLVVGEKDMAAQVVSPRLRNGEQLPALAVEDLARKLAQEATPPKLP
jgi:threonyl-tRNA synthetase